MVPFRKILVTVFVLVQFSCTIFGQVQSNEEWWLKEPYRLIQTNLREIDAIDFNVDTFIHSINDIGANTVLINVGGIVANYYTELEFHYRNPNLKFDLIAELIGRLHKENIRVLGRFDFSKLNDQLAIKKPEWLYKSVKGEHVNYNHQVHTCFNGGYQQDYAYKILSETLSKLPLDGVFFNMPGYQVRDYSHNYHGICQSDACRKRFEDWSGGLNLPVEESTNDSVYRKYMQFKAETSSIQFTRIHELIKSFGNHIAICTYTHAGTDFYRKESNSHAAIYDDFVTWEYSASHNVKSALGSWKGKQVSNAAVHFYGYPARHSADARWLTQQRLFENIMNGAGLDFYCIGRLDNLEDRAVLQNVKDVYQFHKQNETYLHHTVSKNKVLLLHDRQSENEYKGVFEILTENHVLFDVMEHWCLNTKELPREIESYEVVVLPGISRLSNDDCQRLDTYVNAGGKLLVTGFTSTKDAMGNPLNKIRLNSLGADADFKTFEKEQGTYFRIFESDKPKLKNKVFDNLDLVYAWEEGMLCETKKGAEKLLGFIPPAMIGPPEKCYYTKVTDIPGLIFNGDGKGKTAFFPFQIGSLYHHTRHYGHSALVMSALNALLQYHEDVQTSASPLIELSRQKSADGRFEWFGLLNHSGQLGNAFHEPLPIQNIRFSFTPDKKVKSVKSMVNNQEIPFHLNQKGKIEANISNLNSFEIVLVEY